jgi:hypothetical protein
MRLVPIFSILALCLIILPADAALTSSGNEVPIATGENVFAGAAVNDSPGSSDLTLIVQIKADNDVILDEGDECTAIQPLENIPDDDDPTGWTLPEFDDSDWKEGELGIGYGDGDDNLVIGDGQHAMVYCRAIFVVKGANQIKKLTIGADFDDGCVLWINGVEVARESGMDVPDIPEWDSWTDKGSGHSHEASKTDPPRYDVVDVDFKVVGSIFAVDPHEKLTTTWSQMKSQ